MTNFTEELEHQLRDTCATAIFVTRDKLAMTLAAAAAVPALKVRECGLPFVERRRPDNRVRRRR